MRAELIPLPRRTGRIAYRHRGDRAEWGFEDFSITREADGGRSLTVHCELAFGGDAVVRDTVLSVDAAFQPRDAYVRILNHGTLTGSGWFRFVERRKAQTDCSVRPFRLPHKCPILACSGYAALTVLLEALHSVGAACWG